jgi:spore germination protein GerM
MSLKPFTGDWSASSASFPDEKKMERRNLFVLAVLVLMLIILSVVFFTSASKDKIKRGRRDTPVGDAVVAAENLEKMTVTLFFLSENDTLLHPEEREIIDDPGLNTRARRVVQELLNGSQNGLLSPFPPETKLRELHITEGGTAYVDFTREIQENHLFGSSADIATVYCIVNSLTHNFEIIKKVFILIDGGEKETLGGHIDLSRPFVPRMDLIAQ